MGVSTFKTLKLSGLVWAERVVARRIESFASPYVQAKSLVSPRAGTCLYGGPGTNLLQVSMTRAKTDDCGNRVREEVCRHMKMDYLPRANQVPTRLYAFDISSWACTGKTLEEPSYKRKINFSLKSKIVGAQINVLLRSDRTWMW